MDLGKLRIEYRQDNNIIQIYNSPTVCSLVINGNVVDVYRGFVAIPFKLKGSITREEKEIQIMAKMGLLFMKLYYDGVCVAKKFMGFG